MLVGEQINHDLCKIMTQHLRQKRTRNIAHYHTFHLHRTPLAPPHHTAHNILAQVHVVGRSRLSSSFPVRLPAEIRWAMQIPAEVSRVQRPCKLHLRFTDHHNGISGSNVARSVCIVLNTHQYNATPQIVGSGENRSSAQLRRSNDRPTCLANIQIDTKISN